MIPTPLKIGPGSIVFISSRANTTTSAKGKRPLKVSYYISSIEDSKCIFHAIRDHWKIENQLHYMLDVYLGENGWIKRAGGSGHKHGAYGQNRSLHPTASQSKAGKVDSTSADAPNQAQSSATLRAGTIMGLCVSSGGNVLVLQRSQVIECETDYSFASVNIKRNDMDRLISTYDGYAIWKLSAHSLYQLAKFVVYQNYKHHAKEISDNFESDVLAVYREELKYYKHSQILIATTANGQIVGSIRVMNWDREQPLPIQTLFDLGSFTNSLPSNINVWHIGRFAVSAEAGSSGLTLFKLLLLYAMRPVFESDNDLALAECDNKLLHTMRLMGIQVKSIGESMEYLGSETTPIYATRDGLAYFFNKNRWLMDRGSTIIA